MKVIKDVIIFLIGILVAIIMLPVIAVAIALLIPVFCLTGFFGVACIFYFIVTDKLYI